MKYIKRALMMPSGSVYESGMNIRERRVIFDNAFYDLIEAMSGGGDSPAEIARFTNRSPKQIAALLLALPDLRTRTDSKEQAP